MLRFILRRLLLLPLVLVGVTFLLFFLTQRLSPEMRASLYVKDPRQMGALEEVIRQYGLRDHVLKQYGRWMGNVLRGDLGYSPSANMPVAQAMKEYLPATIQLAFVTILLVVLFGVWFGSLSAVHKDKWQDILARLVSVGGFSLPIFVLGLLLLMVFYGKLGWFAPGGYSVQTDLIIHGPSFKMYTGFLLIDSLLNGNLRVFADVLRHLVLPAVTLCVGSFALMVRVMRSSMLEELNKDYIRAARAKGLSERAVVYKHAGKNAIIPVITLASIQFIRLLGGTVIVETIFDYPGIGRFGVMAAQQLDIAGILGFSLMVAVLFVLGNLLSDILYTAVDPRIRLE
ncbi:MAG: ABC transporter permease [Elusimicrobiaceae bacterium]|uniref:ABC transporter permease n=1 Tax=Candidatus Avelusimicrobium gallicola TaxID=2562704 RepID=A0A928DR15_9BACT|nr:ABC transporter permease [Elusimicrobium sp.]MBQ9970763.1 ABC transporter permease [Elusimicrobiaceae bacterium]